MWKWLSIWVTSVMILSLFFSHFWSLTDVVTALFLNKKDLHNSNVSFCVPQETFFVWFILLKSPCPCCVRVCVFVCVSQMYCGWWDASPHSQQFWCWLAPQLCYYKSHDQHSAVHLPIETGTVRSHGLTGCCDSHHWFKACTLTCWWKNDVVIVINEALYWEFNQCD